MNFMNKLAPVPPKNAAPAQSLEAQEITAEYYTEHYLEFLPRYISHGRPSQDTLASYTRAIEQFKKWCLSKGRPPLTMQDYQMRIYLENLMTLGYKEASIALMMAAVRNFFMVARRIGLIRKNPCDEISTVRPRVYDEMFRFYTPEQIQELCNVFKGIPDEFIRYRNLLVLHLLGVEGLRNVEVHRLNDEDFNWNLNTLLVRGKEHNGVIYPANATVAVMQKYLQHRPASQKEGMLTPTIVCDYRHNYRRITRDGIRLIMNKALTACNLKEPGYSCHILRHSCGTNLYQKTKDLRLVQEQLRHRDPKMTARYAHVQERMSHRYTDELAPQI